MVLAIVVIEAPVLEMVHGQPKYGVEMCRIMFFFDQFPSVVGMQL